MLNETLLDIASFFDYATIVVLRLTNKHLLRLTDRYADQLALRRSFSVIVSNIGWFPRQRRRLFLAEIKADNSRILLHETDFDAADNEQLISAVTELQSLIGPHAVREVDLDEITFSVKLLVDNVPALRHASEIRLNYASGSSPSLEEYTEIVSFFQAPTRITLWEIPVEALVAFLQSSCASKLKDLSAFSPGTGKNLEVDAAQENAIFGSCFDFANLEQDEPKRAKLLGWNLRWEFLRRLIEAADSLQRIITIEVSMPVWVHPESFELGDGFAVTYWRLPLDPTLFEEKSVAISQFFEQAQHGRHHWLTIAYSSKRSDVVVFVRDGLIYITNNPRHIDNAIRYGEMDDQ